jgi:hypothetical protein
VTGLKCFKAMFAILPYRPVVTSME